MDITDKQSVFDTIQQAKDDNTQLWSIATQIANQAAILKEIPKNTDGSLDLSFLLDDPKRARAWLVKQFAKQTTSGNPTAGKILGENLGLFNPLNELQLEVIDYSTAIIDCPHCGGNIHQQAQQGV